MRFLCAGHRDFLEAGPRTQVIPRRKKTQGSCLHNPIDMQVLCREAVSHCSLILMDNGSMREARLDFTVSWQHMDISKTVLELMFSTETVTHCCGYVLKLISE